MKKNIIRLNKEKNSRKGLISQSYISNLGKRTNATGKITSTSVLDNFIYRIFNY